MFLENSVPLMSLQWNTYIVLIHIKYTAFYYKDYIRKLCSTCSPSLLIRYRLYLSNFLIIRNIRKLKFYCKHFDKYMLLFWFENDKFLLPHLIFVYILRQVYIFKKIRGCAEKSLSRPGRKQATATKLGIYSTYSPRSAVHFLTRCSNFCKPHKKKIRRLSVHPGLRGSNDLRVGRKMATLQLFFQSREQVVVRLGQIRRIWWVIKTLEAQIRQFLLGCKYPVSRGIVVQVQDLFGELPAAFFLQMSFNCTSRDE